MLCACVRACVHVCVWCLLHVHCYSFASRTLVHLLALMYMCFNVLFWVVAVDFISPIAVCFWFVFGRIFGCRHSLSFSAFEICFPHQAIDGNGRNTKHIRSIRMHFYRENVKLSEQIILDEPGHVIYFSQIFKFRTEFMEFFITVNFKMFIACWEGFLWMFLK